MQLPPTLTLVEATTTLAGLRDSLARHDAARPFRVDASALQAFDTSAIAVLLDLQRQAQARGVAVQLVQAPAKLQQLATLYGVEGLLPRPEVVPAERQSST